MPTWTDPGPQEFDAPLESGTGGGCWVTVPVEIQALFGGKGRVPVLAYIDDVEYRGSVAPYGGAHRLGVLKSIRQRLGKEPGSSVHIRLSLDTQERVVELDKDIEIALADAALLEKFRAMAFTHQREYAEWIASAKREPTRRDRLAKLIAEVAAR